MKHLLLILLISFLAIVSCTQDETKPTKSGDISFSLSQKIRTGSRTMDTTIPAALLISVKDDKDNLVYDNRKLSLSTFGQGYISESLKLNIGNYSLTQFIVLDASGNSIYATPLEGSALASEVVDPLPIKFSITENGSNTVTPQVIAVTQQNTPDSFGYASFGFEIVGNEVVKINANVKIEIGGILYENLDATISVKGYNATDILQWSKDYDFSGPSDNVLEVKGSFHHYSIELANKWGVNDVISNISAKQLWNDRADGLSPVTYVLGGAKQAKKLSYYVSYLEGNNKVMQPNFKASYSYAADGKLESAYNEIYNTQTLAFEESFTETFTYSGSPVAQVSKIITTRNNIPQQRYDYEYGVIDKITEKDFINGLTTTQSFTRIENTNSVDVNYSFSNGNSFSYQFDVKYKNRISDITIQSGQTCNEGVYTYDKNINPFVHLGYQDASLVNWSANNRVTENVVYKACSYPSIVPVQYDYTYDDEGYPITKRTTFKSGTATDSKHPIFHSEEHYFYK